jgi:hypothetical protein
MEQVPVMLRTHRFLGAAKRMRGFEVTMARAATKRKLTSARAKTTPSQPEEAAASWERAPIEAKQKALRSTHPMDEVLGIITVLRFKPNLCRK